MTDPSSEPLVRIKDITAPLAAVLAAITVMLTFMAVLAYSLGRFDCTEEVLEEGQRQCSHGEHRLVREDEHWVCRCPGIEDGR